MKTTIYFLFTVLLISCSSPVSDLPATPPVTPTVQVTQTPESTKIPDAVATLYATSPSLEIAFDGKTCLVNGADELKFGEHLFILHNQSGYSSSMRVGMLYPEKSWEDVLNWFKAECGSPGSTCRGNKKTEINWINWLKEKKSVNDGRDNIYFLFDIDSEGEYIIWVNIVWGGEGDWPCGPFQVVAGP